MFPLFDELEKLCRQYGIIMVAENAAEAHRCADNNDTDWQGYNHTDRYMDVSDSDEVSLGEEEPTQRTPAGHSCCCTWQRPAQQAAQEAVRSCQAQPQEQQQQSDGGRYHQREQLSCSCTRAVAAVLTCGGASHTATPHTPQANQWLLCLDCGSCTELGSARAISTLRQNVSTCTCTFCGFVEALVRLNVGLLVGLFNSHKKLIRGPLPTLNGNPIPWRCHVDGKTSVVRSGSEYGIWRAC
jgi:hypothetical protein